MFWLLHRIDSSMTYARKHLGHSHPSCIPSSNISSPTWKTFYVPICLAYNIICTVSSLYLMKSCSQLTRHNYVCPLITIIPEGPPEVLVSACVYICTCPWQPSAALPAALYLPSHHLMTSNRRCHGWILNWPSYIVHVTFKHLMVGFTFLHDFFSVT